jgi:hypothetical protein
MGDYQMPTLFEKNGSKRLLSVPIGEPFLFLGRTLFGSRKNYFGFHVEPNVERVLRGTKKGYT